jgi:uncharacterized membrane protein YqiK
MRTELLSTNVVQEKLRIRDEIEAVRRKAELEAEEKAKLAERLQVLIACYSC